METSKAVWEFTVKRRPDGMGAGGWMDGDQWFKITLATLRETPAKS